MELRILLTINGIMFCFQQNAVMLAHLTKLVTEKGLDSQSYHCAGCKRPIGISKNKLLLVNIGKYGLSLFSFTLQFLVRPSCVNTMVNTTALSVTEMMKGSSPRGCSIIGISVTIESA